METNNEKEEMNYEEETNINEQEELIIPAFIFGGLTFLAGVFLGSSITKKKEIKIRKTLINELNNDNDKHVKMLLKRICPRTHTKYIVERFDDYQGKTYGEFRNPRRQIETIARITAKEIKNELTKEN